MSCRQRRRLSLVLRYLRTRRDRGLDHWAADLFVISADGKVINQVTIAGSSRQMLGPAFNPVTNQPWARDFGAGNVRQDALVGFALGVAGQGYTVFKISVELPPISSAVQQ